MQIMLVGGLPHSRGLADRSMQVVGAEPVGDREDQVVGTDLRKQPYGPKTGKYRDFGVELLSWRPDISSTCALDGDRGSTSMSAPTTHPVRLLAVRYSSLSLLARGPLPHSGGSVPLKRLPCRYRYVRLAKLPYAAGRVPGRAGSQTRGGEHGRLGAPWQRAGQQTSGSSEVRHGSQCRGKPMQSDTTGMLGRSDQPVSWLLAASSR